MTDQDEIRSTYEGYVATGRGRLWDLANPGFARLSRERDDAIRRLVADSGPSTGAALLDMGCGGGQLVDIIADLPTPVVYVGIDLLPDRIAAARAAHPDATFVVGDAEATPFEPLAFDVITAITLFSSLPSSDLELGVAREISRIVRPGGWLVWYDLRYDNPSNRAVHGISRAQLTVLFPGWRQELRTMTVAPPIARRLGRLTPIAYPVLHALPFVRSHLVGRLQRPMS